MNYQDCVTTPPPTNDCSEWTLFTGSEPEPEHLSGSSLTSEHQNSGYTPNNPSLDFTAECNGDINSSFLSSLSSNSNRYWFVLSHILMCSFKSYNHYNHSKNGQIKSKNIKVTNILKKANEFNSTKFSQYSTIKILIKVNFFSAFQLEINELNSTEEEAVLLTINGQDDLGNYFLFHFYSTVQ